MMKKLTLLLLVLAMGTTAFAYNNTYALIVGVADYKNCHGIDDGDLVFTVSDAVGFANFLKSKKGGSVPASHIVLLTDAQATKLNTIAQGKALFAKAKKDDRVIFYFSGHGSKGCFLPYDFTRKGENLLSFSEVKTMFRAAKCSTKLLFADACFAGSMKKGLAATPEWKKHFKKGNKEASNMNIAVMMSCQSDETSIEMPSLKQGLFTYYLMEGLGGKANSDGNKYVTIQELYYYLYHRVKDRAAQCNPPHKQTPELFGKFDLRLIVANL